MRLNRLFKNPLITGTIFMSAAGVISRLIGFFYRIFLSRTIGAERLGIYQLIAPVFSICFALTASSIQTAISKFVGDSIGSCNTGECGERRARAYLIIGLDLDTMSPLGGTEVLQPALNVCQNAQNLTTSAKGWKPFDSNKNRYAIINDYLDAAMTPYRQMQYKYHREGLDVMAENPDRGRAAITQAIDLLAEAHQAKALSMLPQIFTEYKRDELVGIYQGKGSPKDKEHIGEVLSSINASQSNYWNKLKR